MSDGLTDKQRAFIAHYVACLNASEAARRAGYSHDTARQIGHENLTKPNIRAAIDAAMAEVAMPKAEVLARLAAHARADLGDFLALSGQGVRLDLKTAKAAGLTPLIKKYTKTGRGVTIELYDAQEALQLLGKYYKLWTDVHEHAGEVALKGYTTKDASPDAWDDTTTE